jgi:hypothetical protein
MFFEVEPGCTIGKARIHTEDAFIVTKKGGENVSQHWSISNLQVIKTPPLFPLTQVFLPQINQQAGYYLSIRPYPSAN